MKPRSDGRRLCNRNRMRWKTGTTLHHIATLPAREAACGDLSPGQIASRTQYIVTVARAGVHGALMNLVSIEGPNGMLHSFSKDDPRVGADRARCGRSITRDCRSRCTAGCWRESAPARKRTLPTASRIQEALRDWVRFRDRARNRRREAAAEVAAGCETAIRWALSLEVAQKAIADGQTIVATRKQPWKKSTDPHL